MTFYLVLVAALLTGLDLYLSYSRMRRYSPVVELNPVVRQVATDFGVTAGVCALGAQNVAILVGLVAWHAQTLLTLYVGARIGLAAMQLKSLQLERIVERLLERKPNGK